MRVFPLLSAIGLIVADTLLHRPRRIILKQPAKHVRCGFLGCRRFLHRGTTGLSASSYPFQATLAVGPSSPIGQQKTRRKAGFILVFAKGKIIRMARSCHQPHGNAIGPQAALRIS